MMLHAADVTPTAAAPPKILRLQMAGCNTDCGRVELKLYGVDGWSSVCARISRV